MSKRIKKDIKKVSDEISLENIRTENLAPVDSQVPSLTIDGAVPVKRSSGRKSAKPAVSSISKKSEEDPELQQLLMQVDQMLTEMTQSKWLSADFPTLQIDFSNK